LNVSFLYRTSDKKHQSSLSIKKLLSILEPKGKAFFPQPNPSVPPPHTKQSYITVESIFTNNASSFGIAITSNYLVRLK